MITTIHVLSYEEMLREVMHNRLATNAIIVSITDPEEDRIFEEETDRILAFQFHDVDPAWFVNWTPEQRAEFAWMTEEDAKRCAAFIFKHHEAPEPCVLYVNCMAGVSRSGAVGEFAHRVAATDRTEFLRTNPDIHPNPYMLRLLMRELYSRDWPELEG